MMTADELARNLGQTINCGRLGAASLRCRGRA
jgi:hypothetical protein